MSVRMRIVVIALVPVIGFLANGFTFTTGEAEVDHAFESVRLAGALEDASRDFKDALSRMRTAAVEFAREPRPAHISAFNEGHDLAPRRAWSASRNMPTRISSASCRMCAM